MSLVALHPAGAQRAGGQPPALTLFAINGGADTVPAGEPSLLLTHRTVGARPSEYHVSTRADFAGAPWLAYMDAPTLSNWYRADGEACDATRNSHRVTLFFQVRATVGEEVRVSDGQRQLVPSRVESNVLCDAICARP
jgi:hypothetical protein